MMQLKFSAKQIIRVLSIFWVLSFLVLWFFSVSQYVFGALSPQLYLWKANTFYFGTSSDGRLMFASDTYTDEVDVASSFWKFHNITLGTGSELDWLRFEASNMNVTLSKLYESSKLFTASCSSVDSSSYMNLTVSGYSLPYVQKITGDLTAFDVNIVANNELAWTVSGTGAVTIKVYVPSGFATYYLKINNVVHVQGDKWTHSGNHVTVTDTLASTNSYVLSFHALETVDSGGGGEETPTTPTQQAKQFVEQVIAPKAMAITSNWISVLLLSGLLLGTVASYAEDPKGNLWKVFLVAFIVLTLDFLFVFVIIPMGYLPIDLSILRNLTWKPPTLQLQTYPIGTQMALTIIVLGIVFVTVVASIAVLIMREG
jgi:hypothetical protein